MKRYDKHIIITGSARSGTSWLSEVIARQFRYRMLFEPEHEFNTSKGVLIADQWIQDFKNAPEAYHYLKQVFANRVDNDWIAQLSNRKYKMHLLPFIPKKYVIKFVRANLSAKYMNETFKIPVIHIIRNPYDVLASQQRVQFPWLYNLEHFKNQADLMTLVKKEFNFDINNTESFSLIELLTTRWCLENVLPLQVFEPLQYNHRFIRHEDLRNDINIFLELCKEFNLEPIDDIAREYTRPSSKTHPRSTIINPEKTDRKFKPEELKQINRILHIFRCELYPIQDE